MSPDLSVIVRSAQLTPERAWQIATEASWPSEALPRYAPKPRRWLPHRRRLGWFGIGAHDILDDQADWDAATWLFEPEQLPRFIRTIGRLYELVPEDFTLVAVWGDEPVADETVTREELLKIVSENRLGNRIRYRVSRRA